MLKHNNRDINYPKKKIKIYSNLIDTTLIQNLLIMSIISNAKLYSIHVFILKQTSNLINRMLNNCFAFKLITQLPQYEMQYEFLIEVQILHQDTYMSRYFLQHVYIIDIRNSMDKRKQNNLEKRKSLEINQFHNCIKIFTLLSICTT